MKKIILIPILCLAFAIAGAKDTKITEYASFLGTQKMPPKEYTLGL